MDRDLQILVNTPDHLQVDSPAASLGSVYLVFLLLAIAGVSYLAYRLWAVSRLAAAGVVLIALVVGVFVFADMGTSYRLDMDRGTGQLTTTAFSGSDRSKPMSTETHPLDSLTKADMETDRRYRRITISTRSGQPVHPLGPDFTIMDSQFNVLGEIQRFLGQQQSAPVQ